MEINISYCYLDVTMRGKSKSALYNGKEKEYSDSEICSNKLL